MKRSNIAVVVALAVSACAVTYAYHQHQWADLYQREAAEWKDLEAKVTFVKNARIELLESELAELERPRNVFNANSGFIIDRSCIGGPRIGESIEDYAKRFKTVYGLDLPQ